MSETVKYPNLSEAYNYIDIGLLKNIKVAYIDSGFSYKKSKYKKNSININIIDLTEKKSIDDKYGHGTIFADILCKYAYQRNAGPHIFALKASNNQRIYNNYIAKGINFAIENDIDILSINSSTINYNPEITSLLYTAYEKGMICLAPAGNYLHNVNTYPASLNTVIGCTSVNDEGTISENVNVNEHIDVCSLEENIFKHNYIAVPVIKLVLSLFSILKIIPKDFDIIDSFKKGRNYGTSSSLPAVVACVALMKSVNKNLTTNPVRDIFRNFSRKATINKNLHSFSIGKLDFLEAVKSAVAYRNSENMLINSKYYFKVSKDNKCGIQIEVFDIMGKRVNNINNNMLLEFFPFSISNRYNSLGIDPLFKHDLSICEGKIMFKPSELVPGEKYLLKITDKRDQINNSLSVI